MLADHAANEILQVALKVLAALERIGILPQALGHCRVEYDIDAGDGRAGAGSTELKLVAREGKGRGAVPVGGVLRKTRQGMDADLELFTLLADVGRIGFNRVENLGELRSEEHGNDRGRRLVSAESVVVAGGSDADAQHILIIVHCLNDRAEAEQKQRVLRRRLAGLQKIHAGIGAHGPVVVLAGAVDAGEGLFMQQTDHAVAGSHALHRLHRDLVVIRSEVAVGIDRRKLMLRGSSLVVLRLGEHTELPQLLIEVVHERLHAGLDAAEIMVVQLLTLRGLGAKQRAAGVDQILTLIEDFFVHQEVFLLGTHGGDNALDVVHAEELHQAQPLAIERIHAAQQRRFLIERLAAVGAEGRRDAEHVFLDERIARRVPGGVASGLKGRAQTAGRKARRIRLAANELLAGKLHDHMARIGGRNEAVMLLRGHACHRLEPMRKVRAALFDRPVLHGVGHNAGRFVVQPLAGLNRALHLPVSLLGQPLLHHGVAEHVGSKKLRDLRHMDFPFRGRVAKSGNEAQRTLSVTPLPFNVVTLLPLGWIVKARDSKK